MLLLTLLPLAHFAQPNSAEDVKKEAARLFEDDQFIPAYKLYSQLVANFPKDPEYNYRLGVCMIYAEPDKKKCISYLKAAAANPKDTPKDVNFYLGKAYHINYLFDDAIKAYSEFKKTASSSLQRKLQVDREIKACNFGKKLLSSLTDLEVQSKKSLNEADYFRSYDLRTIGGKLLVKPEDFKTAVDKKKKERSVMFLPKGSNVVYFSSYGETTETGKDIYTAARLPSGEYSKPQKVAGINTEFDEDYPFLHPDGKTLYFASKGHNSMGGYDIFKTTFVEETGTWTQPVNLEFPINSPDDDYLFVTDSLEKTAYFSTGRQSPPGKIDVLKINTERKPIDVLVIKGTVLKENDNQSVKSIINIKLKTPERQLGEYEADDNGEYDLELPNGGKLVYTVETPGFRKQSKEVTLPLAASSAVYKQLISYENGELKISELTDDNAGDNNYLRYLKQIEKKARLDVNEGENKLQLAGAGEPLATADSSGTKTKTKNNNRPKIVEEEGGLAVGTTNPSPGPTSGSNVDNKQLAQLARQDAEEAAQEYKQLNQDAADARETSEKLKIEAGKKLAEVEEASASAATISNEEEKKNLLDKAAIIKRSAENDQQMSEKMAEYAKALENDALNKQQEARLNQQYATELEASAGAKNKKESLAKIESLQKQLSDLNARKPESENLGTAIKTELEQKESQLARAEKIGSDVKSNLEEIKTAIATKEGELAGTKKKARKEELSKEIDELKAQKDEKEKQLIETDREIAKAAEEANGVRAQSELMNRIKTEDIATLPVSVATPTTTGGTPITTTPTTTTAKPVAQEATSAKALEDKYAGALKQANSTDKEVLEQNIAALNQYNNDIDKALADNRNKQTKAKKPQEKQKYAAEIKQLETTRQRNQQQIAAHTATLKNQVAGQQTPAQTAGAPQSNPYAPIAATSGKDAVDQLNNLEQQLKFNDNENFDFNSYQNPTAQALKTEADARINDAVARQKKLKDQIATSRSNLQTLPQNNTTQPAAANTPAENQARVEALNKDAEELHNQSVKKFNDAKTKEGAEKEQLLTEARDLEEKSNSKLLEATEVTRNDNQQNYSTNQQNIDLLMAAAKSDPADQGEAARLSDESKELFKKAQEIRTEVAAQTNSGAKLGILGNAEEKEAEAILKQQQAIELLKKANPEVVLKTPTTGGNTQQTTNAAPIAQELETVNNGLTELAAIKIESYQKLADANASELTDIENSIQNNQQTLNSNPALKSDYIAASNKLREATQLKDAARNASTPGEQLANLVASVKKQNEAIKQLTTLNTALVKVAANTPSKPTEPVANSGGNENQPAGNEAGQAPPQPTVAGTQPEGNTEQTPVAATNQNNGIEPAVQTPTQQSQGQADVNTPAGETDVANLAEAVADTSTSKIISHFNQNKPSLSNARAGALLNNSINNLVNLEKEIESIDQKLNNPGSSGGTENTGKAEDVAALKSKSESLMVEADNLSNTAIKTRKEAQSKQGAEKDALLATAKELEEQALDKNVEGATLMFRATEVEVATNSAAIDELLGKLRNDNPELSAELGAKKDELNNLKLQAQKLRAEAEDQTNKAAKLGAITNAEERELELLQKQEQVLAELKKQYPDYVVKPVLVPENGDVAETPEVLTNRKNTARAKQFTELTNITNAFSLEFESGKDNVQTNLDAGGQKTLNTARSLNAESKRLLVKSANEKDPGEKLKLLSRAARLGSDAVTELRKVSTGKPVATVTNPETNGIGTTTVTTGTGNGKKPNTETPAKNKRATETGTSSTTPKVMVRIEGLEVRKDNAYNDKRPIPMDARIEDGLIFRVQIGAFKTQLPNNAFKGLNPLNGESTPNGYYRYTAGNFTKYELANAVKNDLRGLGYNDAFVVAYFNGKRITLGEALDLLAKEGRSIDPNAPKTAGITANVNVPKATAQPVTEKAVVSKEIEKVNGLLFTIQVGVYNRQVSAGQLRYLKPIFTEQVQGGLFRYTAGIYNNADRVIADKNKVVALGIKDAFVSAYLNGKKIPFASAREKQSTDQSIKMETEDPVVFPTPGSGNDAPAGTPSNDATPVQPFNNGVSNYPAATADNGVKNGEEGISFKVQIGAYSKQVPADVAEKFNAIKAWPVENKQVNGLYIYNIGNFTEARFAKQLKEEALKLGLDGAFIVVYKDGKKLYGNEAASYLTR